MLKCSAVKHLTLISGPQDITPFWIVLCFQCYKWDQNRIRLSFSTNIISVRLTHLAHKQLASFKILFFLNPFTHNYLWVYTCDRICFRSLPHSTVLHWLCILITKPTPKAACDLGHIVLYILLFIPLAPPLKIDCRTLFSLENMVAGTKQKQHQSYCKDKRYRRECSFGEMCSFFGGRKKNKQRLRRSIPPSFSQTTRTAATGSHSLG